MLTTGESYRDLGGDYFTRRDPERATKRLVAQLERLGHIVTLEAARQPDLADSNFPSGGRFAAAAGPVSHQPSKMAHGIRNSLGARLHAELTIGSPRLR